MVVKSIVSAMRAGSFDCDSFFAAAFMQHVQNGFFMNWFGNQKGEGFEYHLLVMAMGLAMMIKRGGGWSIDRADAEKL